MCFTLAVATMYGLDELAGRCVQWVNRHMVAVWPTRSLLTLPPDVLDTCVNTAQQHLVGQGDRLFPDTVNSNSQ